MKLKITNLGRNKKDLEFYVYGVEDAKHWLEKSTQAHLESKNIEYKDNKIYANNHIVGEYEIIEDEE